MAGGLAWWGGHAWQGGAHGRYYEIGSMSGRYASYWNAFLFYYILGWKLSSYVPWCFVQKISITMEKVGIGGGAKDHCTTV